MRELKATDKITQKMTRDGAVSENLATGEVEHMAAICSTVYVRGSGSDFFSFLSIVTSMYLPCHFD